MPKRRSEDSVNIVGGRDVVKLQKLLKQSEADDVTRKKPAARKHNNSESEVDEEIEECPDFNECIEEVSDECLEGWNKFFDRKDDGSGLFSNLEKNINEAKSQISEKFSQYTGSIPDDFRDLRDIDGDVEDLPEEVKNHIRLLSDVLKHYRSGPLPKTVKMLPQLPGCETLLDLLNPLDWNVHVYPRVVKIFASKGREPALHFYENCLLPKVKQDIADNRRLSLHLFEALIASMFRAEEFVSGILLPWIQSDMTKTEGVILSNLLKKATLKARFAAVALALVFEEDFSIPRSLVIEALLSKHYHMPEAGLSRALQYFLSFDRDCSADLTDEHRLPVTWFRSLLIFVESYPSCLGDGERGRLVKLCRRHEHPQITTEIRVALSQSRPTTGGGGQTTRMETDG